MRAEHIDAFVRATAESLEQLDSHAVEVGRLAVRADLRPRRQISLVADVTGSVTGRIICGLSLSAAQKIAAAAQGKPAMTLDEAAASALTEWFAAAAQRAATAMGERGCTCEVGAANLVRLGDDPGEPHPEPAAYLPLRAGLGDVELAAALSGDAPKESADGEQIISQAELDALTAAVAREGVVEASLCDFARAPGLAKSTREMIERRLDACASTWSTILSQQLRTEVEVRRADLRTCPRGDLGRQVAEGSPFASFAIGGENEFVLQWSPALAFYAIDRLLGGAGEVLGEWRPLTVIEKGLMETLAVRLIEGYARSGGEGAPKARLLGVFNQTELPRAADEQMPMLLASFEVSVGEMITSMSLAIPQRTLSASVAADDAEARIAEAVAGIPVNCTARLAALDLPLAQVALLRPGDLLALEVAPDAGLDFVVDGQPRLRGAPVAVRERLAVRVTGAAERTDRDD